MRWQVLCALSALMLGLLGCGVPRKPVESSAVNSGITAYVWANTGYALPGETVKFRAMVRNNTDRNGRPRTHVVELKDQPVFDLWVEYQGKVVARWSDGKPLTRDLTYIELKPGESKTIEMDYVVSQCCDPLSGSAIFIYSERFARELWGTDVVIYIRYTGGH